MAKKAETQSGKIYRGRRRLPKLPSRRYAAVISTAFMGAAVVAFSAEAIIPEDFGAPKHDESLMSVSDRYSLAESVSDSKDYGPAVSVDVNAPDVWYLPLRGNYTMSSQFGPRWGRVHWGVDLAAATGTPIYAVHDGVVRYGGYEGAGYGNFAQIDHGNGVNIWYAHMSERYVVTGQHVTAGQMIGRVGSTGRSTGPHLHFEVRVNGGYYDSERFMREHGVDLRTKQEEANGGTISS